MTDEGRKQVRIAIPVELVPAFNSAKRNAEDALKVSMTDGQYAARLIRWALGSGRDKTDP